MLASCVRGSGLTMQIDFASSCGEFDRDPVKRTERRLLEALRVAVAEISIKELAYRLDVSPSLLADSLAERASKGVRASWLVTIIELASDANAMEIANALLDRKSLDVQPRKELTAEQKAERYEEKLRSLGPIGLQMIRDAHGGKR
jgi:hypothetical protein